MSGYDDIINIFPSANATSNNVIIFLIERLLNNEYNENYFQKKKKKLEISKEKNYGSN